MLRSKNKINKNDKSFWYCLETNFKNLDGDEFEKIVAKLYQKRGFYVFKTPKGADQGVDLIARKGKTKIIIQTKNWRGKVSNTDILKTAGARQMFHAKYALVITSSHFTESAKRAIRNTPNIRGMEIDGLKRQFRKYFVIKKPPKESLIGKIRKKFTPKRKVRRRITTLRAKSRYRRVKKKRR